MTAGAPEPADPPLDEATRSFWRPTGASAGALTLVALPSFLVGAFAPRITEDLGFGETALGAVFSLGYLMSAVVLQAGGSRADRDGPRPVLRFGVVLAGVASLLIATTATTFWLLALWFALNRTAEAIVQPATNTLVSRGVVLRRRGIAMGIKQSAIPLSTALAGLAVPLLGDTLGWRGTFALVAALALPVWLAVPISPPGATTGGRTGRELWRVRHLRLAAVAGGLAAASVVTVSGFLTTAGEEAGYSEGAAGLLLGIGGLVMVASRLAWGLIADRRQFDRFRAVAFTMGSGAAAFALLAVGTRPTIALGALLVFGVGWSWPGLVILAVLEQHPDEPGATTAVLQTGVRLGALLSPLTFGRIVETWGFRWAWTMSGVLAFAAGALMLAAAAEVRRHAVSLPTAAPPPGGRAGPR